MFTKIEFENYKAFHQHQEIEFKPLTILLGKNSSGKSSICKLLMAIAGATNRQCESLLPLKVGEVVLSSRYENLFHNNLTSDMMIGVTNSEGECIKVQYLMSDGNLMISEYAVYKDEQKIGNVQFKNKDEFKRAEFTGVILQSLINDSHLSSHTFLQEINYIGPIREEAPYNLRTVDGEGIRTVGYTGSGAYYLLLKDYLKSGDLFKNVSDWFYSYMDGQRLDFKEIGEGTGIYQLLVKRGGAEVNITEVGEGVSQVLPIIVQSFYGRTSLSVIEQPSLHLNPAAHAHVAYRLAKSAKEFGNTYIVETHSDTFLLGLKKLIAAHDDLTKDDVVIYYVDHDDPEEAILTKITLNDDLEYSSWPTGLFEDNYGLVRDINDELL